MSIYFHLHAMDAGINEAYLGCLDKTPDEIFEKFISVIDNREVIYYFNVEILSDRMRLSRIITAWNQNLVIINSISTYNSYYEEHRSLLKPGNDAKEKFFWRLSTFL